MPTFLVAAAVVNIAELATQFDEEVKYIWTCVRSLSLQRAPAHHSIIQQPTPQHKCSEGYVHLRALLSLPVVLVSASRRSREGCTDKRPVRVLPLGISSSTSSRRAAQKRTWRYGCCTRPARFKRSSGVSISRCSREVRASSPPLTRRTSLITSAPVHLLFGSTRKVLLLVSALGLGKLCLDVVIAVDIYRIMQANGTGVYTSPTKPLVIFACVASSLPPFPCHTSN